MNQALLLSFCTVFLWALDRIFSRWALLELQVNPVVFTCFSLFVCAVVLIIIAGPGRGGIATLKQPHTWVYGLVQVLMNISGLIPLTMMTSTEASFLARVNIILSLLLAWMFFERKPHTTDWLGMPFILLGFLVVAQGLPPETRWLGLFWLLLGAFFNTVRTFIAETHPTSLQAGTIKERCRVTGYVVMATSFIFTLGLFSLAALRGEAEATQHTFAMLLPELGTLLDKETLLAAGLFGLTLLPLAMYFYFYAAKVAKTELFLMVATFQPFIAFGLESLLHHLNIMDMSQVTFMDMAAGLLITCGALCMIYGRYRRDKKHQLKYTS